MVAILRALHEEGHVVLLRGKNRFRYPTPGGWADFMLNFSVTVVLAGGGGGGGGAGTRGGEGGEGVARAV